MIKRIFLHIGIHKTASSTIQSTFYKERSKLLDYGVLYPVFKVRKNEVFNHSIPFYSLFCKEPEKYHINVRYGFTTHQAIQQLHHNYCRQIEAQIAGFCGETLIISGEDIWLLSINELKNLKTWLKKITHPEVNIRVVLMCRHPVSRFRSALQASVCALGLPVQKAIERNMRRTDLYQNLITAFSEIFDREHIIVLKYEDSINHAYGPAGAFLALIDKDLPDKIKPALLHDNLANNYETFVLLNAINQNCYDTSGYELQRERMVNLNHLFREMPGRKFMLSNGLSKIAWETLSEDANWLCREFSLPEYQFLDEDLKPDAEIWSRQTLDFIDKLLPVIPVDYQNTVIELIRSVKLQNQDSSRNQVFDTEHTAMLIKNILNRNLTYLSESRLQSLALTCQEIEKSEIPGIFIEAGCALGGSSIIIASSKNLKRKLLIYDVFGMIPSPSENDPAEVHNRFKTIADGKSAGIGGEKYYGYEEDLKEVVKSNFLTFNIDPEKQSVSFIKGLIQETMKIDEPVAFAHIDVDWYEPVLFCLETVFPKLVVGGSIIIDDYYDWGGCRKAADEYLKSVPGQFVTDHTAGSLKVTKTEMHVSSTNDPNEKSLKVDYNEIAIEKFLVRFSGQEVVYCANPGNAGDALIAHATFQLFEKLGIKLEIIKHKDIVYDKIIFYAGGGNLVEGKYKNAYHFINNNFRQNREIILLPHTIHGYDELLLSAKNLTIFCREKTSYQNLAAMGFPSERLFLAHDMAFQLAKTEFQDYLINGKGTANCYRTDKESARAFDMPNDNLDISLSWNGELWHRPDFAKNVTHNLASYMSAFETIKTDRLHVAILAAIIGKKVVLYPNNYYKIKAVFEYSIKDAFDNVELIENPIQNETLSAENTINELQEKLKKLEDTLQEKEQQIAALRTLAEQLKDVFQSKSWRITKPLRNLISFFKKR